MSLVNLCFHGIGDPQRELEAGEDRYWVTVEQFEEILDDVAPWPDVRISFDDGNKSDIEVGLPALQRRGLSATFFVLSGRIDASGSLSSEDLRELTKSGMRIGSHGMDHRPWRGLDDSSMHRELVEARVQIADRSGTSVDEVALPLGRYDRRLLGQLRSTGYRKVHTSDRRVARPQAWIQPRFSVRREDEPGTIRSEVESVRRIIKGARLGTIGAVKRLR